MIAVAKLRHIVELPPIVARGPGGNQDPSLPRVPKARKPRQVLTMHHLAQSEPVWLGGLSLVTPSRVSGLSAPSLSMLPAPIGYGLSAAATVLCLTLAFVVIRGSMRSSDPAGYALDLLQRLIDLRRRQARRRLPSSARRRTQDDVRDE